MAPEAIGGLGAKPPAFEDFAILGLVWSSLLLLKLGTEISTAKT